MISGNKGVPSSLLIIWSITLFNPAFTTKPIRSPKPLNIISNTHRGFERQSDKQGKEGFTVTEKKKKLCPARVVWTTRGTLGQLLVVHLQTSQCEDKAFGLQAYLYTPQMRLPPGGRANRHDSNFGNTLMDLPKENNPKAVKDWNFLGVCTSQDRSNDFFFFSLSRKSFLNELCGNVNGFIKNTLDAHSRRCRGKKMLFKSYMATGKRTAREKGLPSGVFFQVSLSFRYLSWSTRR